jgi:phage head maturation protease
LKLELRADGLHISGYVNVPGKESRPVVTRKHGKVNELIEERAFGRALEKTSNIPMTLDHDETRVLSNTSDNSLSLVEDSIGLRADTVITDPEVIDGARKGLLKGWSFGMREVVDTIEERANKLPLRRVSDLILDHVTLVMRKNPFYSATSIELRADEEFEIETRSEESEVQYNEELAEPKAPIDYTEFENRINTIKN